MKPAWNQLAGEYKDSSSVVIGDVDCTVETELCSTHGVKGYPTIKYWTSDSKEPKDYQGGRDFDSLKSFTADTLEVKCDVEDPVGCTAKEVKFIAKVKDMDEATVAKQLARLQGMTGKSMKPSLKKWLVQRLNILKQF
jgi:protein disulfide-isomerase A6